MQNDEITKDILIALIPKLPSSNADGIESKTQENLKMITALYKGIFKTVSETK